MGFKKGDKLRCVDAGNSLPLVDGAVYVAEHGEENFMVAIEGVRHPHAVRGRFAAGRFELVTEPEQSQPKGTYEQRVKAFELWLESMQIDFESKTFGAHPDFEAPNDVLSFLLGA